MLLLACTLAWLLGGVPFGLVLVRLFCGVDIRTIGSGNVGATNASRAFPGRARLPVFLLIYVLDFGKGFVPAMFFPGWFGLAPGALAPVLVGAAAILGHCVSPFLGFRGGKGVATTTGVFAAVDGIALLCGLGAFGLVFGATRQVFWGSLALGVALPVAVIAQAPGAAFGDRLPITVLALAIAGFLFWTHRSNLRKFRAERRGTEVTAE
jgi:glycerol-3-phosphate acyltransferase PlsY